MAPTAIAFDLYGTLLSTESIARELARLYGGDSAKTVAAQARRYQLEYTWRINSMGAYRPFDDLTRWSFRQAVAEAGRELSSEDEGRIMDAYNTLDAFPEVDAALAALAASPSMDPWVFSNGTLSMMASSLSSLASAQSVLPPSKLVSVDPLGLFKPDRRAYAHLAKTTGLQDSPHRVWLVSANPFDAAGAVAAGLKSAWVDRGGLGWVDGLGGALGVEPTVVVGGVDDAVAQVMRLSGAGT